MLIKPRSALIRTLTAACCLSVVLGSAPTALAETTRLDFVRKEHQRRGPTEVRDNGGWAALARDRSELRDIWDRFRQRGSLPIIRFEEYIAVVAGLGGSGCGTHLHGLRLNRDKQRIVALLYREDPGPKYACTDQYVQETFTVAVRREDLRGLNMAELHVVPRVIEDPSPDS